MTHVTPSDQGSENNFYNAELFQIILNKYLPYYCLWGGTMLRLKGYPFNRISNAPVENYFGTIKINVLNRENNVRVSRLVRSIREHVLAISKEVNLDIRKTRLTSRKPKRSKIDSQDTSSETCSQEQWNKKQKPTNCYFVGDHLKTQYLNNAEANKEKSIDYKFTKCIYCKNSTNADENPTKWVMCDICDGWVHQKCVSNIEHSYSGDFVCKYCSTELNELEAVASEQTKHERFQNECKAFMHKLEINLEERRQLQENTTAQSESKLWEHERSQRLTSSLFGRVFKAKTPTALENIASRIVENKKISTTATTHGLKQEQVALKLYAKKSNASYVTSGLVIHEKYQYLGASPDALVGNDGVVEVKCPYNIRHFKIRDVKLDFLDQNYELKKNHNFYFQIQGILEVTNRKWCDFVVYTFKDISIERIERNETTFASMFPSLRDFYYFYVLPKLVRPNSTMSLCEKKWTVTKEISLLPNGLVNDIDYYRPLHGKNGYTVAVFSKIPTNIKEIVTSDYVTLDSHEWVSDFAIDILLNVIDEEHEYQIIPSCVSTIIFSQTTYTNHVLQSVQIAKEKLAFPILINGNHWCLAVVDAKRKTFLFLDPFCSTLEKTTLYFDRFKHFISCYNKCNIQNTLPCLKNFQLQLEKHIIQKDGYNCGPYIVYFFHNIINGISLNTPKCMDSYRRALKRSILEKSDDMTEVCLLCGRSAKSSVIACRYCTRKHHIKCLNMEDNFGMQYNMCELCRMY